MENNRLIVSIVSAQTIPNIQIIKQFGNENTNYLFITSSEMRNKQKDKQIMEAAHIKGDSLLIDDENNGNEIVQKLNVINFSCYDSIFVNITGGNKIMSNAVYSFFTKMNNAQILYTGIGKGKILSLKDNRTIDLQYTLSLEDFFTACGIIINKGSLSGIPFETTQKIFNNFLKIDILNFKDEFNALRQMREENKCRWNYDANIERFTEAIGFSIPQFENKQHEKKIIKYLTGEWLEEYIYYKIKDELKLDDDKIACGITITSEERNINDINETNDINALTGKECTQMANNELDVAYVLNDTLHTIECKTSIWDFRDGKQINILTETIYKADSIQKRFGLLPKTTILTCTNFSYDQQRANSFVQPILRANISGIKIVEGKMLENETKLSKLIK